MARLREGRANTVRGAAQFPAETIGRVRSAGASDPLALRADSGFYGSEISAVCRRLDVRFSITVRQQRGMRRLIGAIPEDAWTPIPSGSSCAGCARPRVRSSASSPRLRRSPLQHGARRRRLGPRGRPPPSCRDRERHPRLEVRRRPQSLALRPVCRQRGPFAVQVIAHNLARWTARLSLGAGIVGTTTLRPRLARLAGRRTRSARRVTRHLPARRPWAVRFTAVLARLRAIRLRA